jgi:hypothetical protein
MKIILVAAASLLTAGSAWAAGQPATQVMPGDAGSLPAGGLSAHDVSGKWLLDANGLELGRIAGVGASGDVVVRTDAGQKMTVSLSKLSLGNGPNTVILSGDSEADRLNRMEAGVGTRPR